MASAEAELELDISPAIDALDKLDRAFSDIVDDFGDNLAKMLDDVFSNALSSLDKGLSSVADDFGDALINAIDLRSVEQGFADVADEFGHDLAVAVDNIDVRSLEQSFSDTAEQFSDTLARSVEGVDLAGLEQAFATTAESFQQGIADALQSIDAEVEIKPTIDADQFLLDVNQMLETSALEEMHIPIDADSLTADILSAIGDASAEPVVLDIDEGTLADSIASAFDEAVASADLAGLTEGLGGGATEGLSAGLLGTVANLSQVSSGLNQAEESAHKATAGFKGTEIAASGLEVATAGATGSFGALISKVVPVVGIFAGLAFATKHLAEQAENAQLAEEQLNQTFGDAKTEFASIQIGKVNKSLTELNRQTGTSDPAMKLVVANFGTLGISAGKSQAEVAKQTEGLIKISETLSVTNPQLGTADTIFKALQRGLARGGPFLARYGISLTRNQIAQEAMNQTGKTSISQLSQYELAVAGATLAQGQLTNKFNSFDEASKRATVRLRALRQEVQEALTKAALPLLKPFEQIVAALTPIGVSISKFFVGILASVLPIVATLATALGKAFVALEPALNVASQLISTFVKGLAPIITIITQIGTSLIVAFAPLVKNFLVGAQEGLKTFAASLKETAKTLSTVFGGALKGLTAVLKNDIFKDLLKSLGKLAGFAAGIGGTIFIITKAFKLLTPVVTAAVTAFEVLQSIIIRSPWIAAIVAASVALGILADQFGFLDDILGGDVGDSLITGIALFFAVRQGLTLLVPIIDAARAAFFGLAASETAANVASGGIGLVIAAVAALAGAFLLTGSSSDEATVKVDEFAKSTFEIKTSATGAAQSITDLDQRIAKLLTGGSQDFQKFLDTKEARKQLTELGLTVDELGRALRGFGPEAKALNKGLGEAFASSLSSFTEVGIGIHNMGLEMGRGKVSAKELTEQLDTGQLTLKQLAQALDLFGDTAGSKFVDSIRKARIEIRETSKQQIFLGLSTGAVTASQLKEIEATIPLIKGKKDLAAIAAEVAKRTKEQSDVQEVATTVQQAATQEQNIAATAYGRSAAAWDHLGKAIAQGSIGLKDVQSITAAFGIGAQDFAKFVDQVKSKLDEFVQSALSKLPTVADALSALGDPTQLQHVADEAQAAFDQISSNADSTAEEIADADRKVQEAQEALHRSLDPQAFVDQLVTQQQAVTSFLDHIQSLYTRGFRLLAKNLLEQGPVAAGGIAASFDAIQGDTGVLTAAENALGPAGAALVARTTEIATQVGAEGIAGAKLASGQFGITFKDGVLQFTGDALTAVGPAITSGLGPAITAAEAAGTKITKALKGDVKTVPKEFGQALIDAGVATESNKTPVITKWSDIGKVMSVKFKENFNPKKAVDENTTGLEKDAAPAAKTSGTAVGQAYSDGLKTGVKGSTSEVKTAATNAVRELSGGIGARDAGANIGRLYIEGIVNSITSAIPFVAGVATGLATNLSGGIGARDSGANIGRLYIEGVIAGIVKGAANVQNSARIVAQRLSGGIGAEASGQNIGRLYTAAWARAILSFEALIRASAIAIASRLSGGIGAEVSGQNVGRLYDQGIAQGIANNGGALINAARAVVGRLSGGLGAHDFGVGIGANFDSGIAQGILANGAIVRAAAVSVAQSAARSAKFALGIFSPSQVMAKEVGEPIAQGIAKGIIAATPDVVSAMNALNDAVLTEALSQKVPPIQLSTAQSQAQKPKTPPGGVTTRTQLQFVANDQFQSQFNEMIRILSTGAPKDLKDTEALRKYTDAVKVATDKLSNTFKGVKTSLGILSPLEAWMRNQPPPPENEGLRQFALGLPLQAKGQAKEFATQLQGVLQRPLPNTKPPLIPVDPATLFIVGAFEKTLGQFQALIEKGAPSDPAGANAFANQLFGTVGALLDQEKLLASKLPDAAAAALSAALNEQLRVAGVVAPPASVAGSTLSAAAVAPGGTVAVATAPANVDQSVKIESLSISTPSPSPVQVAFTTARQLRAEMYRRGR